MTETTRREFLKQMALAGAAVAGLPVALEAAESISQVPEAGGKSRIVVTTNTAILKKNGEIVQAVANKMMDQAMARLMDTKSAAEGWKKLFKPTDVVGIKVSSGCGVGAATHPEVAHAVAHGLKLAGVKPENTIIFDRFNADLIRGGYKINSDGPGIRCRGDEGDYGEAFECGVVKGRISKTIEKVDAIVNASIFKHHGMTGVTMALKNNYGSFDSPGNYHDNCGDPAIADLNAHPLIKQKTRLVVADAIRPMYDGGPLLKPDALWNMYSIMIGTDPLALDSYGLKVMADKRKQLKLPEFPPVLVGWIKSAQDRGVGQSDLSKIEVLKA